MKRVVVTGLGLLTSIGDGVKNTWDNLILCKSGIKKYLCSHRWSRCQR